MSTEIQKYFVFVTLLVVLSVPTATFGQTLVQRTENFDVDPEWDAVGTVTEGLGDDNNFGYQPSPANAAGGASPGEMGGQVTRYQKAYYADHIGNLDPSVDAFSMRAVLPTRRNNASIGFFDADSSLIEPWKDFIGISWDGVGFRLRTFGERSGYGFFTAAEGVPFNYELTYDPALNGGNGQVFVRLNYETVNPFTFQTDVVDESLTYNVPNGLKDMAANFDHWGLMADYNGQGTTHDTTIYLDDVEYTALDIQPGDSTLDVSPLGVRDWADADQWVGGPPDQTAILGFHDRATSLMVTGSETVTGVKFNNDNAVVVGGPGTLVLDDASTVAIDVSDSDSNAATAITHQFQVHVDFKDPATITAAEGTVLEFNNLVTSNGNDISTAGSGTVNFNNVVDLDGGTLANSGLAVGSGIIEGNLAQTSTGTLSIQGGSSAGLTVTGHASLGGTLEVTLAEGYTPSVGDVVEILSAATVSGAFDAISLPEGTAWDVTGLDGGGSLSIVAVPEPAAWVLLGCAGFLTGWRRRGLLPVVLCCVAIFSLGAADRCEAAVRYENFNSDPGWEAVETVRPGVAGDANDYGFKNSDNTGDLRVGQTTGGGEAGGEMTREIKSYYADDIGEADPSTTILQMAGQMFFPGARPGNLMLGWFDKDEDWTQDADGLGGIPRHWIGLEFDGARPQLRSMGERSDYILPGNSAPVAAPFEYLVTMDPVGLDGDPDITGVINGHQFSWNGSRFSSSIVDSLNNFDRFGLLSPATGTFHDNRAYIDDVTYTDDSAPVLTSEWSTSGVGSYISPYNWDSKQVPMTTAHTARFGSAAGGPSSVGLNHDFKIRGIEFDGENNYSLSGSGKVTLDNRSILLPSIEVTCGSATHEIQLGIELLANTTVAVANGATLELDGNVNLGGNTVTSSGAGVLLFNNNTTSGAPGTVDNTARLGGGGTVNGTLNNNAGGVVAPGAGTGTLSIAENYSQSASATLDIEVGGTTADEFDLLAVSGTAALGGDLEISLADGFTPAGGDSFEVLAAGSISGAFANVASGSRLNVTDGSFQVSYGSGSAFSPGSVVLSAFQGATGGLTGDYNGNGQVDAADYTFWADNVGNTDTLLNDLIGGEIGAAHYQQWKENYGNMGTGSGAAAAVPEPTALVLVIMGLVVTVVRRGLAGCGPC